MKPAEVLRQAADLIEKKGWWDGQDYRGGRQCALTAIGATASSMRIRESAYIALAAVLPLPSGYQDPAEKIIVWNDSQSSGVIATMRACADALEARV